MNNIHISDADEINILEESIRADLSFRVPNSAKEGEVHVQMDKSKSMHWETIADNGIIISSKWS